MKRSTFWKIDVYASFGFLILFILFSAFHWAFAIPSLVAAVALCWSIIQYDWYNMKELMEK